MKIVVQCPSCGSTELDKCPTCRRRTGKGFPDLIPPDLLRDPVRRAEIARYEGVAGKGPGVYLGHAEARPELRAGAVKGILREIGADAFVEVGPGFGELLAATPEFERVAVDHSVLFLSGIHGRTPDVRCVVGLADRLPVARTPALVADGVFQSLPYKEAFLCECGRVADSLVMSVGYRWNYPRRPQQGFDVRDGKGREVLVRFLEELGFGVELRWLRLADERWISGAEDADFLYVVGRKC